MKIRGLGSVGLITDPDAVDIPIEGWEQLYGIRCEHGKLTPVDGSVDVTNWTRSTAHDVYLHCCIDIQTPTYNYWVYAWDEDADGVAEKIYAWNGGVTHTDITRISGSYSPGADDDWNVTYYNNFVILNYGDTPQVWDGIATNCVDLPYVSGSTWASYDTTGSGVANSYSAKVIRSFRGFLVAFNITEDSNNYSTMVHWSDAVSTGELPSWDYRDPATLSNRQLLADTNGDAVDGLQLRDQFVLYKTDAIYIASVSNSQFAIQNRPISVQYGIFAAGCVADIGGKHVVLGQGLIYTFDGSSIKNILEGQAADGFFQQIDEDYYHRCFVVHNIPRQEVWFCFPEVGSTWATKALVWNYFNNTWHYRPLDPVAMIRLGQYTTNLVDDSWSGENTLTWDAEATTSWSERFYSPGIDSLIGASKQLIKFEAGVLPDVVYAERTNLMIDTATTWFQTQKLKLLATGQPFTVELGGQKFIDGPVYWEAPQTWTPGITTQLKYWSTYPIKALRISSAGKAWTLSGYDSVEVLTGDF